jgi:hypothetical protein
VSADLRAGLDALVPSRLPPLQSKGPIDIASLNSLGLAIGVAVGPQRSPRTILPSLCASRPSSARGFDAQRLFPARRRPRARGAIGDTLPSSRPGPRLVTTVAARLEAEL